jgi:hypothetical protein
MIANRILNFILRILSIIIFPFWIVIPLVLGLAVSLSFGLLILPISFIWMILLLPMVTLSWISNKVPSIRNVIGIVFIPWAIVADTFVLLMPSMGEIESRALKLMLCASWPYTWEFWQFSSNKLDLEAISPEAISLKEVINRISSRNPLMKHVVMRLATGQEMDSN